VGKLVLYLADGTTMNVVLDKERITIGRRADNDVCLPYPAVSGEHAQVVTILADSFLEDLGSTNGTLVNGKAVAKHFLNDYDQIDIGRQRLTYMSDNDAKVDPLPPDLLRHQMRGLTEKVEPARALPQIDVPAAGDRRPQFGSRSSPLLVDLEGDERPARKVPASPSPAPRAKGLAKPSQRLTPTRAPEPVAVAPGRAEGAGARTQRIPEPAAAPPPLATTGPLCPFVRVLSGPSIGRMVPFPNPELTVGRVGVQVAIVRKVGDGYKLFPLEGSDPPRINGAPVATEGTPLHPGDTFEVAGVRLELSADS
jgi:predicted component of type VI protein secretion system